MYGHQEGVPTRAQPCWLPDLRLPAPRTVRNKCLVCKPPVLVFGYSNPDRLRQATGISKVTHPKRGPQGPESEPLTLVSGRPPATAQGCPSHVAEVKAAVDDGLLGLRASAENKGNAGRTRLPPATNQRARLALGELCSTNPFTCGERRRRKSAHPRSSGSGEAMFVFCPPHCLSFLRPMFI